MLFILGLMDWLPHKVSLKASHHQLLSGDSPAELCSLPGPQMLGEQRAEPSAPKSESGGVRVDPC